MQRFQFHFYKKILLIACLILIVFAFIGFQSDENGNSMGTFQEYYNTEKLIQYIGVSGSRIDVIREKMNEINNDFANFHKERIHLETIYTLGEMGRDIDWFTEFILNKADSVKQVINKKLAAIMEVLQDEEIKRMKSLSFPDLTDVGKPLYGNHRTPPQGEGGTLQNLVGENYQPPKSAGLDIIFFHESHTDRGIDCITCHKTTDENRIKMAYERERDRRNPLTRGERSPVADMARCMTECHDGEIAPGECSLCHPSYQEDMTLVSDRNHFDSIKRGMPALLFTLHSRDGTVYSLEDFIGKKIIILQFGSST